MEAISVLEKAVGPRANQLGRIEVERSIESLENKKDWESCALATIRQSAKVLDHFVRDASKWHCREEDHPPDRKGTRGRVRDLLAKLRAMIDRRSGRTRPPQKRKVGAIRGWDPSIPIKYFAGEGFDPQSPSTDLAGSSILPPPPTTPTRSPKFHKETFGAMRARAPRVPSFSARASFKGDT